MPGLFVADDLGHKLRRNRREQDTVAEMTRSNVIAGNVGRAENRQTVRRARTKTSPVLENLRVLQLRHQLQSRLMLALDRGWNCPLIEPCLLDRRADEQPSIASRDEIHLWRPHDMP